MIQINRIKPPEVKLYNPDKKLMGIINEYELMDIRVQIKNSKSPGYYLEFENYYIIRLDINGELEYYPDGLLSIMTDYILKLL